MDLLQRQYTVLHKGLNMSVDLSAFATFGKHAPHRGGFTQTIDATYLTPLSKDERLWMALGVYLTNTNYGGDSYHDGGLYGILGYKINMPVTVHTDMVPTVTDLMVLECIQVIGATALCQEVMAWKYREPTC